MLALLALLTGCGKPKIIHGTRYETQGLFTEKNPSIHYEVSAGNVVWSILLIETIAFPVYFVGFSIWNPVCLQSEWTNAVSTSSP